MACGAPLGQATAEVGAGSIAQPHEPMMDEASGSTLRRLILVGGVGLALVAGLILGGILLRNGTDPEQAQREAPTSSDATVQQHARQSPVPDDQLIDNASEEAAALEAGAQAAEAGVSKAREGSTGVGYGNVEIGMTLDDLLASGEVEISDYDNPGCADRGDCEAPCETYGLVAGGQVDMAFEGNVVGQIAFGGDMATSKGIKVGSTEEKLIAAYPDATLHRTPYPEVTEYVVPIRSGVHYFAFVSDGQVSNLVMSRESAICIE